MEPRLALARAIATVFGAGHVPAAPGTVGSLIAVPIAWVVLQLPGLAGPLLLLVLATAAFASGVWATGLYAAAAGRSDPSEAIIDEVAGQFLVLIIAAPDTVWHFAAGFVLFRFFDIVKPWPVSWAQRRLRGGWAIMLDDILAALCALIVLAGAMLLVRAL
jgi:phosphatidylglycerophosphatase A